MSAKICEWLDGLLNGDYDFTVYSQKNARAELAALRAQVADQAIELHEAYVLLTAINFVSQNAEVEAWLAANAPEPQEQTV